MGAVTRPYSSCLILQYITDSSKWCHLTLRWDAVLFIKVIVPRLFSLECKHGHRECGKSLISFLTLVTSSVEKKVENILVACELRAEKKSKLRYRVTARVNKSI